DCPQIELGYPPGFAQKKVSGTFRRSRFQRLLGWESSRHLFLGIFVTFAWFDRRMSLRQPRGSIKVETVNSSPAPLGKNSANFLRTPKAAKCFDTDYGLDGMGGCLSR